MSLVHEMTRAPPLANKFAKIEVYYEPVGLPIFLSFILSKMEKAPCMKLQS